MSAAPAIATEAGYGALLERGRAAHVAWAALGPDARARALRPLADALAERMDALCELVVEENGKPMAEAVGRSGRLVGHLARMGLSTLAQLTRHPRL